jgi:hypothetical protein
MATSATASNPWAPAVTGIVGGIRVDALQARCTELGLLTQAIGPIKERITAAGEGKGVCAALACWWLKGQKTGTPLLKQLLLPGAVVNEKMLDQIVADFKAIKEDEKDYFITKLKEVGLVHRGSVSGYISNVEVPLGDWICEGEGSLSAFFTRGGTNHAMAVDLQKYIFFDPNVGEMKFGQMDHLQGFLNGMFPRTEGEAPASRYMKRDQMLFREVERHSFR